MAGGEGFNLVKRLEHDDEISQYYERRNDLGSGMFGETYEANDVNDPTKHYAIKKQSKRSDWITSVGDNSQVDLLRLFKEILILNRILPKHPNIIEMKDILVGPEKVFMVQELCRGPIFKKFFPKADDESGCRAFRQLAEAVRTLHEHGVVHNDIKSDNVMFQDQECMQLKLIDFGCSNYSPDKAVKRHNNFDYNNWFLHEELFPIYGQPLNDVQALGCMLHCIMAGKHVPFLFEDPLLQMQTTYRPRTERFSPAAMNLLTRIGPEPFGPAESTQYLTMDEICEHPWLTKLPGIAVEPTAQDSYLQTQLTQLQNDLTVLKRLLTGWMIMRLTDVGSERDFANRYEFLGRIRSGPTQSTETAVLKVADVLCSAQMYAVKFIHGRVRGKPDVILEGLVTRPPLSVYMELLIILRVLPPHRNIVKLKNVLVNPEYVALVREYLKGSSLEDFFAAAEDRNSRTVFKQLVDTVRCLHQHGVVHMDLHPSHIRFTVFDDLKIVNFSRAVFIQQMATKKHNNFDASEFLTPELLQPPLHANAQVDITALGRIFHAMMAGKWEPDPARCAVLSPRRDIFGNGASDLLSKIGPEPFGPAPGNSTCNLDDIYHHPWVKRSV